MGRTIEEVIDQESRWIMKLPSVVGIGMTRSANDINVVCISVYVTSNDRPPGLPDQIDGYPVEIIRSGEFRSTAG